METVQQWWQSYWNAVRVAGVSYSDVQVRETKQAFYAGVHAMLMAAAAIGADDAVSEDDGVRRLEGWQEELRRHKDDVLAGKA